MYVIIKVLYCSNILRYRKGTGKCLPWYMSTENNVVTHHRRMTEDCRADLRLSSKDSPRRQTATGVILCTFYNIMKVSVHPRDSH